LSVQRAPAAAGRIAAAFGDHGRRAALMPYLMGGHPDLDSSRAAVEAAADAGADLVELGIPFSDPLADGPVIHAAATEALAAGATPEGVLGVCEAVAERLPVVLMVYANVVLAAGGEAFAARAAAAGAAGLIVPDLPHDEATALREACDAAGLALVPLVAPTTSPERVAQIGADARGFVYAVSLTGTTGERDELASDLSRTVERVRAATDLPVAVGFGISTPEQARAVAGLADGVIVGSRVVRAAGEGGAAAVGQVVAELAAALARD
jgi:tryptophan synthase alpha chain